MAGSNPVGFPGWTIRPHGVHIRTCFVAGDIASTAGQRTEGMGLWIVYADCHFRPGAVATGQSRENTDGPIVCRSGTGDRIERSGDYLSEQSHEYRTGT